jgi:hypothetical protein
VNDAGSDGSPTRRVARPLCLSVDGFLSPEDAAELSAWVVERVQRSPDAEDDGRGVGLTAEIDADAEPRLAALAARLDVALGLHNRAPRFFRARVAGPGSAHPVHSDDYEIADARLWVTAMLYLTAVEGGRTLLPGADPPMAVEARPGRLFAWFNQGADGAPDPHAEHGIEAIVAGQRVTLTWFVYATREALAQAWRAAGSAPEPRPLLAELETLPEEATPDLEPAVRSAGAPTFYCIDDGVPRTTMQSLRRAALARGLRSVRVHPRRVDPRRGPLPPGSMLYSPSTSAVAERVEQQLWQPGVRTFHRRPEGPFVQTLNPLLAFSRAGLPVPRFIWVHRAPEADAPDLGELLPEWVEHLGGLPVVVKAGGGEGGIGTLRADSLPALRSLLDLLLARGSSPSLLAYVPDALHLRLVVVGDRVVTAYRNPIRPGDFRSEPSLEPSDYDIDVDPEWADIAVRASQVVGYAFAGVDLLLHESGRVYLLEANFPCYFAQAERYGADVSGAMLDHLLYEAP